MTWRGDITSVSAPCAWGKGGQNMLRFVWELLRKDKWFYIFVLIVGIATLPLLMFKSTISGQIVDEVVYNQNYGALYPLVGALLAVTLVRSILKWWDNMRLESISQRVCKNLRVKMYFKLCKMDFNYFDKTRTGDIMTRMTADVDMVRHFLAYSGFSLLEQVCVFIIGLAIMFFISWKVTLAILVVAPFVFFFMQSMSKAVHPTYQVVREQHSQLNTMVQENISGNRVVKAFAKEDFETGKFDNVNKGYKSANLNSNVIASAYFPKFEVCAAALTLIAILVGGYFVMRGEMTVGQLVIINSLLWTVNNPIRQLGWLINDVQRAAVSIAKIQEVLYMRPRIKTKKRINYKERFEGNVEFQHVTFKYENEDALEDVSFKVEKGQTVAIIGATGAGKSSLVNLICRFYDVSSGAVLLDGVDVRNVNIRKLRQSISMAMQDIFLFSDTIEGNIAYAKPDVPFEEVERVAKIADAHDFILRFPDGYDTIVGERGVGLSGGQKQRIALARALLKDPSILILDDTTSSVDMETEHHIHTTLRSYFEGRTTFIIAHRISAVKDADKILVLDKGRLIEEGTHDELLAKRGYYYDVYENQLGNFNSQKGGDSDGQK